MFLCTPAWAVPNIPVSRVWELAGFGGGGTYPMIVYDNQTANKLYITSDVAGNFSSSDGMEQWDFMNVGSQTIINASIAQSVSNPDVLYSIGKKLIKSVNRGKSWSTLADYVATRPQSYKVIAINRSDENIVYVGRTNGKIMRTTNGGQTFEEYATPFGSGVSIEFLYINAAGTRLVAGSNGQGMVSYNLSTGVATDIDFADTNGLRNTDFGTYDNSGTEVFCTTAGIHMSCTQDFSTWTDTGDITADTSYYIRRFAVKKLASGSITFVAWGRLISSQYTNFTKLSTNSGSTWTDVSNNVTMDTTNNPTEIWASFGAIGTVFSIAADPHNESNFAIATDWRMFISTDGGLNWVEKVKGAQNIVVSDIACSPTNRCFMASMDVGLQYSDDLGDHWIPAFPNTSNGDPQGFAVAGHVWRVVTLGTQAEWLAGTGKVVATTSNWADFKPRVIISSDNGVTWTVVTSGLPTTQLSFSAWSSATSYVVGNRVQASNGKIYICILNNTNNSPASSPTYWSVDANDKNRAAWGIGYPRALAKCPNNDNVMALGIDGYSATENGGIFVSTNGGMDWTRTTQPTQWKTYNAIAFDPTDLNCNTIEFAEFFHVSPDLAATWRTTDRGVTWANVENDIGIYDMAFASNGKAYKVGLDTNPNIDFSNDGITWSAMHALNIGSQIADGIFVDANNPNRICVGVNDGTNTGTSQGSGSDGSGEGGGSIYCTADAENGVSSTWYNITGDLPSPSGVTAIAFVYNYLGQDWVLVATDGSGLFRLPLRDRVRTTLSNVSFTN